ncbi:hypothetical protein CPB83DRAFT_865442 [Crepidotus variabilis]|uniref:C2H2-type domain-containing protein n=1 Tax=Crepidotus variabilis TaxID=179855 RepID=A0A9P6E2X5_9AGAR|nr:hypothetical protein CPB83DRAFT_865442 [Crepidotus variabilis]
MGVESPEHFLVHGGTWKCLRCPDDFSTPWESRAARHESTAAHQSNLERYLGTLRSQSIDDALSVPRGTLPQSRVQSQSSMGLFLDPHEFSENLPTDTFFDGLLESATRSFKPHDTLGEPRVLLTQDTHMDNDGLECDTATMNDHYTLGLTRSQAAKRSAVLHAINSYGDTIELSEAGDETVIPFQDDIAQPKSSKAPASRPSMSICVDDTDLWKPWPDKVTCTIDIASQIPRSFMSDSDIEVVSWLLEFNGVPDVPSLWQMKRARRQLSDLLGFKLNRHLGAFGHTYYVLHPSLHVNLDFSNPRVRQHLQFYPESSGTVLQETCQAARWLHEADPKLLTPMYRKGSTDFYTFEPTLLQGSVMCIPIKYFWKDRDMLFTAWPMKIVEVDGRTGWIVNQEVEFTESTSKLALSGLDISNGAYLGNNIPSASHILGCVSKGDDNLKTWPHPVLNPWRLKAKGSRVVSYPVWLYCDDTSGNRSKKWNEHNSYLMVAAGLAREMAHQEENVHFLCTSNAAPPLEMLEGIVEDLEQCQTDGVWVYDCVFNEMVLVIVWVLALLGDNPMQAEFACHAGLRAKFFCRICWVKGKDSGEMEEDEVESGKKENFAGMVNRVLRFMTIGTERSPSETCDHLKEMLSNASLLQAHSTNQKLRTETGLKDTFLQFFLDRIEISRKNLTGPRAEQATHSVLEKLPSNVLSPIWRIHDLNPHADTPIEILHVVLLGFVKYFWRDAVERLNDADKETLKIRLSCLDLAGLDPGVAALRGSTLVQYAGSLVGRDFKVIEQVAIFALYDLLDPNIIATWAALSALVPLIWQPKIENLEHYINKLEAAINHFLDCVARWTPQWFNKQKFHLLLHLPKHIRRFGPAILFATEIYESFNAIIRAWSIHSNRLAPSRDIGHHAASLAQIRHILRGGLYPQKFSKDDGTAETVWRPAGQAVLELGQLICPVTKRLGIIHEAKREPGTVTLAKNAARAWKKTDLSHHGPPPPGISQDSTVFRGKTFVAMNSDVIEIDQFVITDVPGQDDFTIGRILEIINFQPTPNPLPVKILLQAFSTGNIVTPYCMPKLTPTLQAGNESLFYIMSPRDILCAVNVQHNCAANMCDMLGTRVQYLEREALQDLQPAIRHKVSDDLVLNTAKIRDARFIQLFTSPLARLDRVQIVKAAVGMELSKT